MRHRLPVECLWQSGGRVTEVLRLRRPDVDDAEGALKLVNLKQLRRDNLPRTRAVDQTQQSERAEIVREARGGRR
jgi:integrase